MSIDFVLLDEAACVFFVPAGFKGLSESDAETLTYQLQRRNKEIEIIEKVASQINKTLNLDAIAKTMLISMEEYFNFKPTLRLLMVR